MEAAAEDVVMTELAENSVLGGCKIAFGNIDRQHHDGAETLADL